MPAKSKSQQKFMGMVHAAKKGEKPASKEVAKVAKGMSAKAAKDFASTKHKGLPEKKKAKIKETLEKINQLTTMLSEAKKKMKGEDPCWDGYEMVGTKKKGNKEVPNCVPKKSKKVKEEIYTAKMGQPPQDIDGGSAPAPKKNPTPSKVAVDTKKPSTPSKVPVSKVKESNKEDPPFDADPPKSGPKKDKYGNEIKNVAKHLAKKGRAEAEEKSKKKKQTVSEGWGSDTQRRDIEEYNKMWERVMAKYAGNEKMTSALEKVKRTGIRADGAELEAMKMLGASPEELQTFMKRKASSNMRDNFGLEEGWTHDTLASQLFETSEDHHDHEASMAKAQLMRIAEQSIELFKMIKEGDNLEGWVAAKITKANDYINAVHQNLSYDDAKDQTQSVSSDDDYIAELRKNLEQQINS